MWDKCNDKIYRFLKEHQVKDKITNPPGRRFDWAMLVAMIAVGGYALYKIKAKK